MLRVGLTGGMACGKSAIAEMLKQRGAHLIQADLIAHQLMQPGEPAYERIVRRFGRDILKPDKTIDRARLAQAAFSAPSGSRIHELNEIIHPAVLAHQKRWMEDVARSDPDAIAVVEAALILEAGARSDFDKIIVVRCQPEQKVGRLAQRLGMTNDAARAELERRSAAQFSDEEKLGAADYVIDNSGTLAQTEAQVVELWPKLHELARQR